MKKKSNEHLQMLTLLQGLLPVEDKPDRNLLDDEDEEERLARKREKAHKQPFGMINTKWTITPHQSELFRRYSLFPFYDLDFLKEEVSITLFPGVHVGRLYVFSLMWSMGAFLEIEDRLKFEEHIRATPGLATLLDLPKVEATGPSASMFDYVVDDNGILFHYILRFTLVMVQYVVVMISNDYLKFNGFYLSNHLNRWS
jgi:hypothetical protein